MQYLEKLLMTALLSLTAIVAANSATAADLVATNKLLNRLPMNSPPLT
ncbi:MAG: hypothetical protein Q7T58_05710 [Methylotenera sp.]|nr:hypothetical protein [Methylotenera sp.]